MMFRTSPLGSILRKVFIHDGLGWYFERKVLIVKDDDL